MPKLPEQIIIQIAKENGVDPALVSAICLKESVGNTWAVRVEKNWHYFLNPMKWAHLVKVTTDTEYACQQMSWGLMQVMGSVARQYNFLGDLPMLCRPDVGLKYGITHLKTYLNKYPTDVKHAIAAYNAGEGVAVLPDGKFENQNYVDDVMSLWSSLR